MTLLTNYFIGMAGKAGLLEVIFIVTSSIIYNKKYYENNYQNRVYSFWNVAFQRV